jgi:hypothetical protein
MDAAFAHPDPFLGLPVIIDAFPGMRAVATPAVAESIAQWRPRTTRPTRRGTATSSRQTIVDTQFGLAPPFEVEDRVVAMKPP